MSKSTLMKLGGLPKAFPEVERFNEDDVHESACYRTYCN